MKKIIVYAVLILTTLGCTSDSNNNNNNSNGNVDYEFTININGVVHKVKGNTSDFISEYGSNFSGFNPNKCNVSIGTTTLLQFSIADITKSNFISGQTLTVTISIPNCQLGQNEASVIIGSPVLDNFNSTNNTGGLFVEESGLYCMTSTNSCQYPYIEDFRNKVTMNITDLGTSTTTNLNPQNGNAINYGNTFKGNFSGIVYYSTPFSSSITPYNFNIPMQLSIDFKAIRG